MGLSVIGAGFGRTGTMSLKLALEQLGLGPCHHMMEVLRNPGQVSHWQQAAAGGAMDWDVVFAGFAASVDWPSCHYWRELAAFYPGAKVILSVRPAERWWESFSRTIMPGMRNRANATDPVLRDMLEMAHRIVAEQTFHAAIDDHDAALAALARRSREVRQEIAAERLLVFDAAEGWKPLCRFLGKPVPETPFPRANSTEEFLTRARPN